MKEMKRLLAMLLAVVMLVGVLPTSVFATEVTDPTAPVVAAEVVSEPTEEATEEATEAATTVTEPVLTVAKTSVQHEAVAASEDAGVAPVANDSVVVIAGSDYQQNGSTAPKTTVTNILSKIKADYTSADGFMFGGDYYQDTLDTTTASKNNKAELDGVVTTTYPQMANRFYIQGNHDADSLVTDGTLTSTGVHDTANYGVYTINEKDYPWGYKADDDTFKTTCQNTANVLEEYLNDKEENGYTKPIFVITHVPLHYSPRTASSHGGDGKYATYLYEVLDDAGEAGLNIIFLFGHNHSNTYDDYIGGGQIYLAKGSTISIAKEGSTSEYYTDTLDFTYMNCGYVGYIGGKTGKNLSMSVFEITEDEVSVKRYGTNGLVELKAVGVTTSGAPKADTTVVGTEGAIIELGEPEEKVTVKNDEETVFVTAAGLTGLKAEKKAVAVPEGYSAYASYDITPEGYTQGKTATVTITLDEADGFDASRKVVVIDGEKETEKSIENGAVTFTTNHFSTYSIGQKAVPAAATGNVYTLVDTIEDGGEYLIVSTNADGSAYAMKNPGGTSDGATMGTTAVTIEGGKITTDDTDIIWKATANDTRFNLTNGTDYLEGKRGNVNIFSSQQYSDRGWNYESNQLKHTGGSNTYVVYCSGSSFTSTYSSTSEKVYLFKRGGSSSVTPNEDGWVTITTPGEGTPEVPAKTEYKYVLDEDGVNAGTKYLIVNTSSDGDAYVLTNNNGTVERTKVTISNGEILVEDDTNINWIFSGSSSGTVVNQNRYVHPNDGSLSFQISGSNMTISNEDNGEYLIYRTDSSNRKYYVRYNNGWTATRVSSYYSTTYSVYLFAYKEDVVTPGTPAVPGTNGLFVKLTGTMEHTVARNLTAEQVIEQYITDIQGAKYEGSTAPTADTVGDDITSELTFEMQDGYNGAVAGDYYVTVYYGEHAVGSIKIIVPEVTIVGYTLESYEGAVHKGASKTAETGAYILVDVKDDEGEDYRIPVTVGMLSGEFDTKVIGEYPNLTVTLPDGEKVEGFKLTVNPKAGNKYPTYPDPGAVQVNKTATGIDFQASGTATVELSASGIPMNEGVDVVIVLDTSSSMTKHKKFPDENGDEKYRIQLLRPAVDELIQQLQTKREDGSDPDIDIAIVSFNGNTLSSSGNFINSNYSSSAPQASTSTTNYGVLTGKKTIATAWEKISDLSSTWATDGVVYDSSGTATSEGNIPTGSGTNYDYGLQLAYDVLAQKQADNATERQQFVMFLSDGAPSQYNGVWSNDGVYEFKHWFRGNLTSEELAEISSISEKNKTFYTGYTENQGQLHRSAEAIKAAPSETKSIIRFNTDSTGQLESVDGLGATVYSIGLLLESSDETSDPDRSEEDQITVLKTIASDDEKFFNIDSVNDLKGAFSSFATDVLLAATNARFVDEMGEAFDLQLTPVEYLPTGETMNKSTINPVLEVRSYKIWTRAEYEAGEFTDPEKIGDRKTNTDGTYIYETLEVITLESTKNTDGSYTLSGAKSDLMGDANILNSDGVICGKYVFYNTNKKTTTDDGAKMIDTNGDGTAETSLAAECFYWNIGDIRTTELALRYNVYLEGSLAGDVSEGSYDTNGDAILYYNNYQEIPCEKAAITPTMAWKGALVNYAFYLVDASSGKPVNNDGVEVPFSNRTVIVNPTFYHSVNLYGSDHVESMSIVANHVLPAGYRLYDESAQYEVEVNGNGTGSWTITGDSNLKNPKSTYVTDYNGDEYINESTDSAEHPDYDYTHTTVWFAVQWEPQALDDTVVVDYGLPVDVHVLVNDMFGKYGKLIGVAKGDVTDTATKAENAITTSTIPGEFGTATVEAPATGYTPENSVIRYELESMAMNDIDQFTYSVQYANPVEATNDGFYYGTLTVIPATTVYYEDSFLTYTGSGTQWEPVNQVSNEVITQDEDRPDDIKYAFDTVIDANNVYGYDSAYTSCSQFSLDNAMRARVNANTHATASFSFYGTGFDVIGLTSNTTGVLWVKVNAAEDIVVNGETKYANGAQVKSTVVNTYYGYVKNGDDWVLTNDVANSLYQVPVMQIEELPYGKYDVTITASYVPSLDKTTGVVVDDKGMFVSSDGYDLYLDAIRIYNPAGTTYDVKDEKGNVITEGNIADEIQDAYKADGEAWPTYIELRNNILSKKDFDALNEGAQGSGAIFIDQKAGTYSIEEYASYGPNNELYLAKGQSVAFKLDANDLVNIADVQIGLKSADGNAVSYKIYDATVNNDATKVTAKTLNTSTDMYYSIKDLASGNIVITNTGDSGILSITNIKFTHTAAPTGGVAEANLLMDEEGAGIVLMSLRPAPVIEEEVPETNVPETTVPEVTEPEVEETTKPETEETKPSRPGKPSKPGKEDKETKPTKPGKEDKETKPSKPGKEDKETKPTKPGKEDKATKPTEPANNNKPAMNNRAEEVRNNLDKAAAAIRNVVTALLSRWF